MVGDHIPSPITSRDNKLYKYLKKIAFSRRERLRRGKMLLEGERLIGIYRERVGEPEAVILKRSRRGSLEAAEMPGGAYRGRTVILSAELFGELTGLAGPCVRLAVASKPGPPAVRGMDTLGLEGIQDPGNMGTMIRAAAAAGFGTVALSPTCTDPWSPKSLRAGMGGQFSVRIEESSDLAGLAQAFPGTVAALVPEGGESIFGLDLSGQVAFILGSEGQGLSARLLEAAGRRVSIPMPGWRDSLNAATAAAVALFETVRQREGGQKGD